MLSACPFYSFSYVFHNIIIITWTRRAMMIWDIFLVIAFVLRACEIFESKKLLEKYTPYPILHSAPYDNYYLLELQLYFPGPLVCLSKNTHQWYLQGAVSWGSTKCDSNKAYTVFARIGKLRAWIDRNMKE